MSSQRRVDAAFAKGRRAKALQFIRAADEITDLAEDACDIGDAYVTLCVHAGIAAADALCAHRMGLCAGGDNHNEAVALLRRVQPEGPALAEHLNTLLAMKTKAGYTHRNVSAQERLQAGRRSHTLVDATRALPL